jgi:hypothetical protein
LKNGDGGGCRSLDPLESGLAGFGVVGEVVPVGVFEQVGKTGMARLMQWILGATGTDGWSRWLGVEKACQRPWRIDPLSPV